MLRYQGFNSPRYADNPYHFGGASYELVSILLGTLITAHVCGIEEEEDMFQFLLGTLITERVRGMA